MEQDILAFAAQSLAEGKSVALLTVTETSGSSPATPGQMMAVLANGTSAGTVGGGISEYRLAQRAQAALAAGETVFSFAFDHSEHGMVCGGGMAGFGNVLGGGPRLVIFGGGHVAQSLAPLAAAAGFHVCVVEDRPELEVYFAGVQYLLATPAEYEEKVAADQNTYVVIATRGHSTDKDALQFCLTRQFAYVGMIGSAKKVLALFDDFRKQGVAEEVLQGIYAPIGLDIASGRPAEIAVSVVAEMLLVKNGGSPGHKKLLHQNI
ncbi:MAG: XdhC family protein [Oscillospiraceae bacterium]